MARALRLAERGGMSTHPNPRVGCVIVRDGHIVGEGFHERAGGPHAEIAALQAAGPQARGADVYVTLEPCCHHGRTPPCVEALVGAGVKRVVAAMEDPNPKVAGKGFDALRAAGVECDAGMMEAEARRVNRGFVARLTRGRPWVTLKMAASIDGRTAMASGESRWVTSAESRADVHRLRAEAGAVLTSVNTVLADDPELTVRDLPAALDLDAAEPMRQPSRIVVDTHLRTPASARVWQAGARRVLLTVRPRSDQMEILQKQGVEVALVGVDANGRVELRSALEALARLEVNEVLVEVGPTLAGSFVQSGLTDEFVCYLAPSLMGHEARPFATLPGLARLDQRVQLRYTDVRQVGPDLRVTAAPAAEG